MAARKSLLYRWFGLGRIPADWRTRLQAEDLILVDEGLRGSVTMRNFRSPGRISGWRRRWIVCSLALTRKRFVALWFSRPMIDVPLDDPRLQQMRWSLEGQETLCVTFDAGLFNPGWSGTIDHRFRTGQASAFLSHLSTPPR